MGLFIGTYVKNRGKSAAIKTGTFAARPVVAPNNTFYVAKDTAVIYWGQAGAWVPVADFSGTNNHIPIGFELEQRDYNTNAVYEQDPFYEVMQVIIIPSVDTLVKVGTTEDGEDLYPENMITAANGEVIQINQLTLGAPKNLYFSGLTAFTTIYYIKIPLPNNAT